MMSERRDKAKRPNHSESMMSRLKTGLNGLAGDSELASDPEQLRLRKAVLILLAATCTILGIFWGITYFSLGRPLAGSLPLGYSAMSAGSLVYYLLSKRYKFFCRSQLLLILILPFLLQWSLGGFAASGSVIIWSILAPIGALMFAGTTRAIPWFSAYLMFLILSGFLDGRDISRTALPPLIVIISFAMNIGAVSAIVFFLLKFFVHAREQAMAELDREHRKVRQSLSLAMEVQQNLLPNSNPSVRGLDIAGKSVYCDETGGDYFDFLKPVGAGNDCVSVVVGDVSDHGIPSALLMATARAFIRQRASRPGSIAEIVTDTNRQLAEDVQDSGRFMTLFYATIDRQNNRMHWLNAGHEPALVYDSDSDSFEELHGGGNLPVGIYDDSNYAQAEMAIAPGQILVIATDGIREASNRYGGRFGKEAFYKVIRQNAAASAPDLLAAVFNAVDLFQYGNSVEDDMTLVIVKVLKSAT
ncbi:MAG: SpoIIE family protein phosphatase [Deltaproteobacteria bacterium]|jgi:serine phosphatase RsbU (regulator of sigma subunit)|nr:SpoIIE family protein phosphatase [Deltaproteobacteria bacterium]MBW2482101.1 SpoIIE family protein phosphatase [Deltaproteobacteria bacterium]